MATEHARVRPVTLADGRLKLELDEHLILGRITRALVTVEKNNSFQTVSLSSPQELRILAATAAAMADVWEQDIREDQKQ